MKVRLLNYEDGQLIQHTSILILKGIVSDKYNSSSDVEPLEDAEFESKNFEIIRNSRQLSSLFISRCNDSKPFIAILELSEGLNTLKLLELPKSTSESDTHIESNIFTDSAKNTMNLFRCEYSSPSPSERDYSVVVLYIQSQNSQEKDSVVSIKLNKISLGLKLVQAFFGEKMFEYGLQKRSFTMHIQSPQVIKLEIRSEDILKMESGDLWEYLARAIRARDDLWNRQCKYVVFMADPWKSLVENEQGHDNKVALGGGGLALLGSDFLKVWPESVDEVLSTIWNPDPLVDPHLLKTISRFGDIRRTVGSLFAASLGSVAHEMGHIFDLGHSELGLMGREYYRMETFFSPVLSYPHPGLGISLIRPKVLLVDGETTEDAVSIGHSCATLLFFHRWFAPNPKPEPDAKDYGLELIKSKLVSKLGLTTIQIRQPNDGKILKEWVFKTDPGFTTTEFQLAKNHIPISCKTEEAQVVIQDLNGNILKKNINRDLLPQSFTIIQRR